MKCCKRKQKRKIKFNCFFYQDKIIDFSIIAQVTLI